MQLDASGGQDPRSDGGRRFTRLRRRKRVGVDGGNDDDEVEAISQRA
jgi:hypothetical protein